MIAKEIIDFLQEHPNAIVFKQDRDNFDNFIEVSVVRCKYSSSIDEDGKQTEQFVIS